MKRDLFENKYQPNNNGLKIFFIDIICFLMVTVISIGFCYAYFSHRVDVSGFSTTANVTVQYQYDVAGNGNYVAVSDVYGKINNGANQSLTGIIINPGDTITILGRALNTSNVPVYVLAKLEVITNKGTDVVWYNIGTNDPKATGVENSDALPNDVEENGYLKLETADMTTAAGRTDKIYQVGAGSLGGSYVQDNVTHYYYKDLAIPYKFDGETYENGDTVTSISLTLHVHQKDHLSTAADFVNLYKPHATGITAQVPNGYINGYRTESIYAAHYITGNKLV